MKKILTLLILTFSLTASAQVRFGAIAGIQLTDIQNRDLVTTSRQGNPMGGMIADIKFSKASMFHILTGLVYAPMGYSKSNLQVQDNQGNQFGSIASHRIGYLQVPVFLSYGTVSHKTKISGGVGPFISFKTNDKLKVSGGDAFGNATVMPAGIKEINSVVAGLGMNCTVEFSSLLVSLHYQQSFNGIYTSQFPQDKSWKINSFGLSVGYFFTKEK